MTGTIKGGKKYGDRFDPEYPLVWVFFWQYIKIYFFLTINNDINYKCKFIKEK